MSGGRVGSGGRRRPAGHGHHRNDGIREGNGSTREPDRPGDGSYAANVGTLIYNGGISLAVDDRTMAHLQVVIINKLRRRESFSFTWGDGAQHVVCWLGPSIPIEFVYSGNRRPALNRAWLEVLAHAANSNSGLIAVPEPPEPPPSADRSDDRASEPVTA